MKNLSNFKHIINIQQQTKTQNTTTGEITKTWSNLYANVHCSIEPLSVKDYIQAQAHQSEITARIKIRHLPNIDSTMRFVAQCGCHAGKIYNPAGGLEDPESGQNYITFPCSQGVNNG